MAGQLRCARTGCGHPQDVHTEGDGCTQQRPSGGIIMTECPCSEFVGNLDTLPASAPSDAPIVSDVALSAPETPPSDVSASRMRSSPSATPQRRRMSETRAGKTRVFRLAQTKVTKCMACGNEHSVTEIVKLYFTANFFDDGSVGEVFIKADQQGATLSGALDAVSILLSMLLQYGAPLSAVIAKLRGMRFPPEGFTRARDIPTCTSPLDLLARWLESYLPPEPQ